MKSLAKTFLKAILFRPRIGSLGRNTYVKWPRRLTNPQQIFIGDNTTIFPHAVLSPLASYAGQTYSSKVVIGNDVYIGRHAQLFSIQEIQIGDGCVLSDYVYMSDNAHGIDPAGGLIMLQRLTSKGAIHIGKNCFIGIGSTILSGITLGEWCIVGSHSVVTSSFPAYSMIAGSPAKLIKRFCFERNQWINQTTLCPTQFMDRDGHFDSV